MVKNLYFIKENNSAGKNAGTKARNDVEKILKKIGGIEISGPSLGKRLPHGNRIIFYFKLKSYWKKLKKKIPKDSYIFIQYPLMAKFLDSKDKVDYTYFFNKISKRFKTIVLIHDLADIRGSSRRDSIKDLKKANYIIAHNSSMINYLIQKGISEDKIVNLRIFDYLISEENVENHFYDKALICFAGNLEKSKFIYTIPSNIRKLGINLYGVGYSGNKEGIYYKGSFSSEKISSVIKGKFGLIWDGDTFETCSGQVGNYLKYNDPHKLSMYLVANMPVVIWKEAAEADFVEKNNIGITINSLEDLENLNDIDLSDYNTMVKNVKNIKSKLVKGEFLFSSLNRIKKAIYTEVRS